MVGREAWEGTKRAFGFRDRVVFWTVGAAILLGTSFCVAPFFGGLLVLGLAVQRANRAKDRSGSTMMLAGLATVLVLGAPGLGVLVTRSLVPNEDALGLIGVLALLCLVPLFGVVSAPFVTVGSHLMRRGLGLDDAFGRALVGATTAGVAHTVLRGLVLGLVVALAPVLYVAAHLLTRSGADASLPVIALFALPPIGMAWVVGFAGACAEGDDERLEGSARPTARMRLLLAPIIAIGFLLVATLVAAAKPLPPWQARPPRPLTCETTLEDYGPHGLSVRRGLSDSTEQGAFVVETADGGGVGPLVDEDRGPAQVCVDGEGGVWLVFGYLAAMGESHGRYVAIDERGVRLDDGIGDRLAVRSSVPFGVSFVLGLCLLAIGLAELARRSALLDVMGREDDGLRAAHGRIVLSGASIEPSGRVIGSAAFSSDDGSHAFSLPDRVRLLGVGRALTQDTKVLLVATEPLATLSLREGLQRWPRSAILIVGPDDARRAVTSEVSRVVGLWAAAATVAFALAAVALLMAL